MSGHPDPGWICLAGNILEKLLASRDSSGEKLFPKTFPAQPNQLGQQCLPASRYCCSQLGTGVSLGRAGGTKPARLGSAPAQLAGGVAQQGPASLAGTLAASRHDEVPSSCREHVRPLHRRGATLPPSSGGRGAPLVTVTGRNLPARPQQGRGDCSSLVRHVTVTPVANAGHRAWHGLKAVWPGISSVQGRGGQHAALVAVCGPPLYSL